MIGVASMMGVKRGGVDGGDCGDRGEGLTEIAGVTGATDDGDDGADGRHRCDGRTGLDHGIGSDQIDAGWDCTR